MLSHLLPVGFWYTSPFSDLLLSQSADSSMWIVDCIVLSVVQPLEQDVVLNALCDLSLLSSNFHILLIQTSVHADFNCLI